MTTVIYIPSDFVACDGLWTTKFEKLSIPNHSISKYLYVKNRIVFFAGSEYAIVTMQAALKGIITKADYDISTEKQRIDGDTLEYIAIEAHTGELIHTRDSSQLLENQIYYLGSGGKYAAEFFMYAKKNGFRSEIAQNNVEGALKYAYYKDQGQSGEPTTIKSWNAKYLIDNTVNNDNYVYEQTLYSRFKELDMERQQYTYEAIQASHRASLLSAAINYAIHPAYPLETKASPEGRPITPERVEMILEDIDIILGKGPQHR